MKTVYVGMSGGVDSSVAAALLVESGYRVVGAYMKNWTMPVGGVDCPWQQDLADARAAAAVLDIPFEVFDFQDEYRQKVVDVMVSEYKAGRTPNPDVLCNQEIKFKLFLDAATSKGADYIATGHYAKTKDGRLFAATDTNKDQSYFLYRVKSQSLEKTFFPLGEITKPEVRRIAEKLGLPTAHKPDSQGICFVGEVGIKDFLSEHFQPTPGPVVRISDSVKVGEHSGVELVTIGQRHGLGIGGGGPYYVVSKDMDSATVFVTDDPNDLALSADSFNLLDTSWVSEVPNLNGDYDIRTRYRSKTVPGRLTVNNGLYTVKLNRQERAVSPGQSAVVYRSDEVVGGGIISFL